MKFKSAIFTQVSGSTGGATFAHNSGGLYMRSRTIPTNPNSPQQQTVRTAMGELSNQWNDTLTQAQRDAWNLYAINVPLTDVLGGTHLTSGIAMYVRSNVPRIQAGLGTLDAAPTIFNLGAFSEPTYTVTAPSTGSLAFVGSDDWVSEDNAAMLLYASRPQNPSIEFFKGPYRFAGLVAGEVASPPTSPESIGTPFVTVAGQKLFYRVRVSRGDGRLSADFRNVNIVV